METTWQIEMLGWLRATQAGRVIGRFRSRKVGALLAYLAYRPHRSHPREVLIELLWPESPWKAGRINLRTELCWLRHHLEPPGVPAGTVLLTEGDTVRLNPAACRTDVAAFEAALQSAATAGTASERIQWLTAAVERYQGELLPGYCDDWIVPERLRLADAFLHAAHELMIAREQAGDLGGALELAWRAASIDPLWEAGDAGARAAAAPWAAGPPVAREGGSESGEYPLHTYTPRSQVVEARAGSGKAGDGPVPAPAHRLRLLAAPVRADGPFGGQQEQERLGRSEVSGKSEPAPGCHVSARERVLHQSLCVRTAEAEVLREQLAARTAEVEAMRQRLAAEAAETRKLRQELAVRTAQAQALWQQLRPAEPEA